MVGLDGRKELRSAPLKPGGFRQRRELERPGSFRTRTDHCTISLPLFGNCVRRALAEAGVEEGLDWKREAPCCATPRIAIENGYQEVLQWLREGWRESGCTALLANNDYVALGAIKAFQEQGLEVPHDVSVVGFDGSEVLSFMAPNLTTVMEPLRSIGVAATERLLQQIHKPDTVPGGDVLLPLTLRVGESSGAALNANSQPGLSGRLSHV